DTRLRRIELPRMDVEDVRLTGAQDPLDSALEHAVRDEAEVRASPPGQRVPADGKAGDADFDETAVSREAALREPQRIGLRVPAIPNRRRNERRVVLEADVLQNRQRPVGDGEVRRAVAADSLPGDGL